MRMENQQEKKRSKNYFSYKEKRHSILSGVFFIYKPKSDNYHIGLTTLPSLQKREGGTALLIQTS